MKKLLILTLMVGCILGLGLNNEVNAAKVVKTQETEQKELPFEELLKLAEQGNFEAQNKVIVICNEDRLKNCTYRFDEEKGMVPVCRQSIKECEEIESLALRYANMGNADIQYDLAVAYKQVDSEKSEYFFKMLYENLKNQVDKGDANAQFKLGYMYDKGQGIKQDYQKAFELYTKSAKQGNDKAQFNLGTLYRLGHGVERDVKKTVKWYTKSAKQGNPDAQNELGFLYEAGKSVKQDYKKALKWYTKAAEQNYVFAQHNMGEMYQLGKGVEQDCNKAIEWHTKAAEQGLTSSQYTIGEIYYKGECVKQDYDKAFKWFRIAAKNNSTEAQIKLGSMFLEGKGIYQDLYEARHWYELAKEEKMYKAEIEKILIDINNQIKEQQRKEIVIANRLVDIQKEEEKLKFSCKNVNTSKINKKELKIAINTMNNAKNNLTEGVDRFENFTDGFLGLDLKTIKPDYMYSNPDGFAVRAANAKGNEILVIYGPTPRMIFKHCIIPANDSQNAKPDLSFCCAVKNIDDDFVIRQYNIATEANPYEN